MSRLLIGLSKLSSGNYARIHKRSFRSFSLTPPYMKIGTKLTKDSPDGSNIRDVLLFDPTKGEMITVSDKTFPKVLVESRQVGSSHGWGVFSNDRDDSLCISDLYNLLASKSNPKMIPLPSLIDDNVWNVAMSSSPSEEDCVVGIKSRGLVLSLCRPHCDKSWTNIEIRSVESSVKWETANLMFSKRDQRFYLPVPRGNFLFSWDLNLENNESPKFHELIFRDIPELDESEWGMLDACCGRSEYLVESASSGERFFVKWYVYGDFSSSHERYDYMTKRFMVFREEETTKGPYMCYTEDIGDVCIFLSKSEAFCIEASSCPGLKPNCIYYIGSGFGIYSLTNNTIHNFQAPKGVPTSVSDPYWIPSPSSL
ncbi:hypothetical protein ISN44_As06g028350 [Arabidopsis suecica]|uniref:KIB1-4 beta-propeller domain-containing protein n=1 Tax=Arabidopsis suecica TaxID=45249 RepID=A0A8T2CGH0_ARASU|nr:hypothetical protein ISN44_As06g028350 [Arabidopsis suecica]